MADQTLSVELKARAQRYRSEIKAAAADTRKFGTQIKDLARQSGSSMKQLGRSMLPVSAAVAAIGFGAVKTAGQFELSFAKMVGLTNVTADEVDGLKDSVLDLAGKTAKAPAELAEALFLIRSAGYKGAEALDILEMSAKGSTAGLGSVREVANIVTGVIEAYGSEAVTAAEATDILTEAARQGKAPVSDYGDVLGSLTPMASELDIGFEELSGTLAFLTRVSGDVSASGTNLRGILQKLIKPSKQGAEELERVGLSADGLRQSVADNGLLDTLLDLKARFEGDSEAMGRVFEDSEGLIGVLALLSGEGEGAAEVMLAMEENTGAMGRAFSSVADTDAFKMQQAMVDVKAAAIEMGTVAAPAVGLLANAAGSAAAAFGDMPEAVQTGVVALGGVVAIGGPMLSITGAMVTNIGDLSKKFGDLGRRGKFLAGGLGVAGVAAAGLFMVWERHQAGRRAFERDVKEITGALTSQAGVLGTTTDAWIDYLSESSRFTTQNQQDDLGRLELSMRQVTDLVMEGADGRRKFYQQMVDMGEVTLTAGTSFDEYYDSLSTGTVGLVTGNTDLGRSFDDLVTKMGESYIAQLELVAVEGRFTDTQREQASAMAENIKANEDWADSAGEMETLLSETSAAQEIFTNATTDAEKAIIDLQVAEDAEAQASKDAAEAKAGFQMALEGIEGKARDARDILEELSSTIGRMFSDSVEIAERSASVEAAIDGVTEALKENEFATDETTEAGRRSMAAGREVTKSIGSLSEAYLKNGRSLVSAKTEALNRVASLREEMLAMGANQAFVDAYIKSIGLTPQDIETHFTVEVEDAKQMAAKYLQEDLGATPEQIMTLFQVDSSEANPVLVAWLGTLGLTPAEIRSLFVVETSAAEEVMRNHRFRLDEMDGRVVTTTVRNRVVTENSTFGDGGGVSGPPTRASGGSVGARSTYEVAEQGPEFFSDAKGATYLITGDQSGTVLSAPNTERMLNGGNFQGGGSGGSPTYGGHGVNIEQIITSDGAAEVVEEIDDAAFAGGW